MVIDLYCYDFIECSPSVGDSGKKSSSLHGSSSTVSTVPTEIIGPTPSQRSLSEILPVAVSSHTTPDSSLDRKQITGFDRVTKSIEPESLCVLYCMGGLQEQRVLRLLSRFPVGGRSHSVVARLSRKLKVRQQKRNMGIPVFDIDRIVDRSVGTVAKYATDIEHNSRIVPMNVPFSSVPLSRTYDDHPSKTAISRARQLLDQVSLFPTLCCVVPRQCTSLLDTFCGGKCVFQSFTSTYTSRLLKPFIFRSREFLPLKVKVLKEICERHDGVDASTYESRSIDFCYFRKHFLPAVNNFISYFFWPVDMNEYLQYPDFSVVVLYGKVLVGCGFMTPDVQVSEAYIPFLLVHPDFQCCGIGKIMLYHLIQSCRGKDVTLHVSVDNPAMLLYQQFGFKVEQFCLNFYEHYYPPDFCFSKHAFFMRLRR